MDSLQTILAKRTDFNAGLDDSAPISAPTAKKPDETSDGNAFSHQNTIPSNTSNCLDSSRITQILLNLRAQIDAALLLVGENTQTKTSPPGASAQHLNKLDATLSYRKNPEIINHNTSKNEAQIIEGVFNGEKMIGPDGREYSIPSNYASKSKLVEGDLMKLSISPTGSFIYKQIGPIERRRLIGETVMDSKSGQWSVSANNKMYKILTASASFFHAKPGMQAVILVPKDGESRWAAVENIFNPNQY